MKPEKIDLQNAYPCPRCKRGQLQAIVLTEAFGCDRCSQIFGLTEDNLMLEQLSTSYPYKKAWQWTGNVWKDQSRSLSDNYLPLALVFVLVSLLVISVLLVFQHNRDPGVVALLAALLLVTFLLSTVSIWLALRNRI